MNLTRERWKSLVASCFINLCLGSMYAWSVFAQPMAELLKVPSVSIAFTAANALGFIPMIVGGRINDRIGPKWLIFASGLIFGLGMFLSGFATNLFTLIVTYGLCVGMGMGLGYGSTIANSVKFFPDKRGLIGGLTTASYGISSVIVPPIANMVNLQFGVRTSFALFGVVFLLIICGCAFAVKPCPPGFAPDGWTPRAAGGAAAEQVNKDWRGMLSDPVFYVMLALLTCGAVFGLMVISCASSIGQNMVGLTPTMAATFVSVLALFNTAGRIVSGTLSDRIGRINTLTIATGLAIAGLAVLYRCHTGAVGLFLTGVSLIGLCFGTFMGVFPGFTADQFGPKNNTVNYGIMWIGFSIAGIAGPTIASQIYAATGAYQGAFLAAGALAVAGLALTFVYRAASKKASAVSPG